MSEQLVCLLRLRPDQKKEIESVRQLRSEAATLRSGVSVGLYTDKELQRFWRVVEVAQSTLMASSTELAERAGLGAQFFTTVARDRRRPKLANFLRALTAIIEIADERLFDVDHSQAVGNRALDTARADSNLNDLLMFAQSLRILALTEIEKLDEERPNDPAAIAANSKQRELLAIFADGFNRIANTLAALVSQPNNRILLRKAQRVVNRIAAQVNKWCTENADEAIDWGIRLPVLAAGVGLLGWAGADMTVATTTVAALVGGPKVIDVIRGKRK